MQGTPVFWRENEILWDKDAIEIREGKHGLGIYAKKNLEAGFEAIQVPKSVVLSVVSTGIANLLEDEDIEGYVGLTVACMYELSRGSESLWSAYLSLLNNRRPQMASDLSAESRELMKMSEVYGDIETDLKDMREDYDNIVVPFLEKHPETFTAEVKAQFFSFEDFKAMTAQVSSRAMDVDNYHVSALVPFADFVNHNSEPNSDYLTHEDVCDVCGAITCEHLDEEDEDSEDDDEEVPDLSAEEAASAQKKRASKKAEDGDEDIETDDENDEDWEDEEINDTCDIILDDDVKKGEEITRHYGPFPNKIFLSKYGFAEIDNENDTVTVQLDMIKKAAEGILGDAALVEERVQWFLETEDQFIGEDDEDDEDSCCSGEHDHDHEHGHEHKHEKTEDDAEDIEKEDFPRDIMYMMHDGTVDDRMLMLLNVVFMEREQFTKVKDDMEVATEYFNDIFLRRALEEDFADEIAEADSDDDEEKPQLKPLDETGHKTTAEEDLAALKKANLSGPLYYGGVCVQGEKQIIENGLRVYGKFLAEL
ncbi:hypothetical protein BGZ68_007136 [Mortierella alpina]|nr:hypothetical protein BGZ68_007136 [Mortierella alpina]